MWTSPDERSSTRALIGAANLPMVARGSGPWLFDDQGAAWLDGSSGAMAASLGHGLPEMTGALTHASSTVAFAHRSQWRNHPAEELADTLAELAPGALDRVLLVSSGSEANEAACKIAVRWQHAHGRTRRTVIASREVSYHGSTLGAQSATGHPGRRRYDAGWLSDWPTFKAPACGRFPLRLHPDACGNNSLDDLEQLLTERDDIAAVITEPLGGAASAVLVPPAGYHERLRELCDAAGVLWIADEVVTGMGRTGRWFAIEHDAATPDLLTLGKGLSGGYAPVAAVLLGAEVADPILRGGDLPLVGHTWSATPLSAAVALAAVRYIEDHDLVTHADVEGTRLLEQLTRVMRGRGLVRGRGLLIGVELTGPDSDPLPAELTVELLAAARQHRLLIYPAAGCADGTRGAGVVIAPPLPIQRPELDELVARFAAAVDELRLD